MLNISSLELILLLLLTTHITAISVSLYIHRHYCHGLMDFHINVKRGFVFWLWLISGAPDPNIRNVHIRHHIKVDTQEDPHSPNVMGKRNVVIVMALQGFFNQLIRTFVYPFQKFDNDVPFAFKFAYKYPHLGTFILFWVSLFVLGFEYGLIFFFVNVFAFWLHNISFGWGIVHLVGYRNYDSKDKSRNVFPLALFASGEELHNNHHAFPTKVNLAHKWYEVDFGYLYLKILEKFGLCRLTK